MSVPPFSSSMQRFCAASLRCRPNRWRGCLAAVLLAGSIAVPIAFAADTAIEVVDADVVVTGPGVFSLQFPVLRIGDLEGGVLVEVETAVGGPSPAVPGDDYVPLPAGSTITLAPEQAVGQVAVDVLGALQSQPDRHLLLRLTSARAIGGRPEFDSPGASFPVCCLTRSITSADLNGNGHPDIVTGNDLSRDISVLLSDGAGGYHTAVSYPVSGAGMFSVKVAIGDINGDGIADIVAGGFDAQHLQVFLGDGHGNFPTSQFVSFGGDSEPSGLAVGDIDGNGHIDIVVALQDEHAIHVLRNQGSGNFTVSAQLPVGAYASAPVLVDLDSDGQLDIVAAVPAQHRLVVFRGDGSGGWLPPSQHPLPTAVQPNNLAVADFDGDGYLDVISANANGPFGGGNLPGSVTVFRGDGQGGLISPVSIQLEGIGRADAIVAADFNGDGRPDVATIRPLANSISVLLNNGGGGFFTPFQVSSGALPSALTVADATGNGILDLITANVTGESVGIVPGDGAGGFGHPGQYAVGNYPHALVVADFTGKGQPEIAVANTFSNDVSILIGSPDGGLIEAGRYPVGPGPTGIAAGDLNGNGRLDLVTADFASHGVSVLLAESDGGFAPAQHVDVGAGGVHTPFAVALGDLNGDGHLDLATVNNSIWGDNLSVLLGNGDGSFRSPMVLAAGPNPVHEPRSIVLADVTGNGHLDMVVANSSSDDVSVLAGDGQGGFLAPVAHPVGQIPNVVVAGDVTGDGRLDLVVLNHFDQSIAVLTSDGQGGLSAPVHYPLFDGAGIDCSQQTELCPWPHALALADVDGDGHLDVVTANTHLDNVSVLLNDGHGAFPSLVLANTGAGPGAVAVADITGDGVADVITANRYNDNVTVLAQKPRPVELLNNEALGTIITNPGSALDCVFVHGFEGKASLCPEPIRSGKD